MVAILPRSQCVKWIFASLYSKATEYVSRHMTLQLSFVNMQNHLILACYCILDINPDNHFHISMFAYYWNLSINLRPAHISLISVMYFSVFPVNFSVISPHGVEIEIACHVQCVNNFGTNCVYTTCYQSNLIYGRKIPFGMSRLLCMIDKYSRFNGIVSYVWKWNLSHNDEMPFLYIINVPIVYYQ